MRGEANLYKKKIIGSETRADFQRAVTRTADGRRIRSSFKSHHPARQSLKRVTGTRDLSLTQLAPAILCSLCTCVCVCVCVTGARWEHFLVFGQRLTGDWHLPSLHRRGKSPTEPRNQLEWSNASSDGKGGRGRRGQWKEASGPWCENTLSKCL